MIYPDDWTDFDTARLFREAEAREHAALEAEAERILAANDIYPAWEIRMRKQREEDFARFRSEERALTLLIAAVWVALIVGITLIGRAMV